MFIEGIIEGIIQSIEEFRFVLTLDRVRQCLQGQWSYPLVPVLCKHPKLGL